ncbi:hypothetical protein CL616_04405 [archaeon]|nr:hypothetical protein [archaeon]|tara:strand:- start:2570 stop:3793 length:1224 start_codon:yes stop_codon:yes gene_type:complete
MKKIVILIMVILLLSCVSATQTVISKEDEFRIDLNRVDPSPMQPGSTSDVYFEITNLWEEDVDSFSISVVESFPFSLDDSSLSVDLGILQSDETKEFSFPIAVNDNAEDGFYTLTFSFESPKKGAIVSESFTIYVQRVNRIVSATSVDVQSADVDTIPGVLEPGEIGEVKVLVENSADYTMEDVSVKLILNSTNVPFAPIGSSAEKHIRSVNPGSVEEVVFDVIALPDAEAGVYKIDLEIIYYDELGIKYTRNDLIGLVIGGVPEFHFEVKDNTIYSKYGEGDITLNIVNVGLTKVKFLSVLLEEHDDFKILSEDHVYLGDVDPDDDEGVTFTLDVSSRDKVITLPLVMNYRDANNVEYVEEVEFEFEPAPKEGNGNYGWIAFFIMVGVFAYFGIKKKWFKKWFKKR